MDRSRGLRVADSASSHVAERSGTDSQIGLTELWRLTDFAVNSPRAQSRGLPGRPPRHPRQPRRSQQFSPDRPHIPLYRPPKDILYTEITPQPPAGPLALYVMVSEANLATGPPNVRCTSFMLLDFPFNDSSPNVHMSCTQQNHKWITHAVDSVTGTPRLEVGSLLKLDFIAFIPIARRRHAIDILSYLPPTANQNVPFNSQIWAHVCLQALTLATLLAGDEADLAKVNIQAAYDMPFLGLTPNRIRPR